MGQRKGESSICFHLFIFDQNVEGGHPAVDMKVRFQSRCCVKESCPSVIHTCGAGVPLHFQTSPDVTAGLFTLYFSFF